MSYHFIHKLYQQVHSNDIKIEGCPQSFTTLASGIFLLFYQKSLDTNKNGLKFHVRIADEDINEALKIIAQTTQKHHIGFFKVAHKPFSDKSAQHGKQFTIYIDETKMNASVLNAFVNDLEKRLLQANIRPNKIGENMQISDRLVPNSYYISYRYARCEHTLSTQQQLFDFLNKHKIPYQLDDTKYPRFVYIDTEIAKELLRTEYLIAKNLNEHDAPIVVMDSQQAHIQLKYLTNARPSNLPYKPPFLKDILENVTITTQQKQADISTYLVEYPNTNYCEIFTNSKYSNQETQKITEVLKRYDIDYVKFKQDNTYVIRIPYTRETENILKENHLISSTYYSETDKTRTAILKILDSSQITQYQSSGRFELAIPTKYSELRNEMMDILQQKGIKPKKLQDEHTRQYFLSFPQTKESLKFVQSLKNTKRFMVPTDYLQTTTHQRY